MNAMTTNHSAGWAAEAFQGRRGHRKRLTFSRLSSERAHGEISWSGSSSVAGGIIALPPFALHTLTPKAVRALHKAFELEEA